MVAILVAIIVAAYPRAFSGAITVSYHCSYHCTAAFDPSSLGHPHPSFPMCTLTATAYKAELQLAHKELMKQAQVNIVVSVAQTASMASHHHHHHCRRHYLHHLWIVSLADGFRYK